MGRYRKFDQDFRQGAVRIVQETGKPIAQVARELGVNEGTLGNWVAQGNRDSPAARPPTGIRREPDPPLPSPTVPPCISTALPPTGPPRQQREGRCRLHRRHPSAARHNDGADHPAAHHSHDQSRARQTR
jgi:Transposase